MLDTVRRPIVFMALLGSSGLAQAQDAAGQLEPRADGDEPRAIALWATRAESDNIGRIDSGERGAYSGLGFLVDIGHETTRIDSSLTANVELREYSTDAIDSEPVGTIDGVMSFALMPERIIWHLQEAYGNVQTDAFDAVGPNNRESLNVLETGPQLDLPLGGRTRLSARAIYSTRRYDDSSTLDNDAELYELGLFRQTTPTIRYGLLLNSNDVEYDVETAPTYEIDRASLMYERDFSTGGVSIQYGTNEISYLDQSTDEPMFRFQWNRAVATRSRLQIELAREFNDAGGNLRAELEQVPAGGDTGMLLNADPFEQKRLYVGYSLDGARTDLTVGLGSAEESYVGASLDNDNSTTHLSLQRAVTPLLGFGVEFYGIEREFAANGTDPARDDSDKTISAWLNRSLGRVFDLALVLTRYERGGAESFHEDRYEIRFTYSPSDSATAALGAVGR